MSDDEFMRAALREAEAALEHGDVPVGALVVRNGDVLGSGKNERELRGDPTAHAEVLALQRSAQALGTWRLEGTTLYVTIEPCSMCAGATVHARVDRLVYGAVDPKAGAALSLYNIPQDPRLNHHVRLTTGVLADESSRLLQEFFRARRV